MPVPTVNATAAWAPWASVRFPSAAERRVIMFMASKSGTVSGFYLDVYRQNADGSTTLLWSSTDQSGNVGGALALQAVLIDAPVPVDIGDVLEVQFRMTGAGSVSLAGINLPYPTPILGFRPYAPGAGRNPASEAAPATISTATRDAMYQGPVPFVSIGIDVGQTAIPRYFYDDFNRSAFGARWSTFGQIRVNNNRVEHSGGTFDSGHAAAMYSQPLLTDTVDAEFDVSTSDGAAGVGLCATSAFSAGAWAMVTDSGCQIQSGAYNSRTTRASGAGGNGRYRFTYTASDNTFRLYRNDTEVASWIDSSNLVSHGVGHRWVGVVITKNTLTNAGRVDNWVARDADA